MHQNLPSRPKSHSASQEIPRLFMEPEGSLPCSQGPVKPHVKFFNMISFIFTVRNCSISALTPKLEEHPLSDVRDCLLNVFAAILYIWRWQWMYHVLSLNFKLTRLLSSMN